MVQGMLLKQIQASSLANNLSHVMDPLSHVMDPLLEKLQEVSEVMETFGKLYFF